jgi:hypothetical protein
MPIWSKRESRNALKRTIYRRMIRDYHLTTNLYILCQSGCSKVPLSIEGACQKDAIKIHFIQRGEGF